MELESQVADIRSKLATQHVAAIGEFAVYARPFYSKENGVTYGMTLGGKFVPTNDLANWITETAVAGNRTITFKKDCLLRLYLPQGLNKSSVTYGAGGGIKCTLKGRTLFSMTITDSNSPNSINLPEIVEYVSVGDTLTLEVTSFYYGSSVGSFTFSAGDNRGYLLLAEKVA